MRSREEWPFRCPECGKLCRSLNGLTYHAEKHLELHARLKKAAKVRIAAKSRAYYWRQAWKGPIRRSSNL